MATGTHATGRPVRILRGCGGLSCDLRDENLRTYQDSRQGPAHRSPLRWPDILRFTLRIDIIFPVLRVSITGLFWVSTEDRTDEALRRVSVVELKRYLNAAGCDSSVDLLLTLRFSKAAHLGLSRIIEAHD